ncbi:MAG: PorP/SprF family type IX secretion system membrane protein [Bacteroidetes bacterium]|nr:PorP/SprF family type IX secretion system membrane protein [Bacteroidota bacterium]MBU1719943.1 PorP/SprF family type IX secretion system membrane protein [Bacteroidota bacterium]
MKKILNIICLAVIVFSTQAQDVHFSQYYASPLNENPANAGFFDGKFRIGGNYRGQWQSVTVPFITSSAYFDMKATPEFVNKNEWIGIGVMAYNDQAGDGQLRNQKVLLDISYHKSLDGYDKTFLSMGFSGGMGQKSIKYEELYFGNQWDGLIFDRQMPTGESFPSFSLKYFDMNMGMMASFKPHSRVNYSVGYSMYHLNRPIDSFYGRKYPKRIKHIIHTKATISGSDRILIEPSAMFTWQANARELLIGANVVWRIKDNALYYGLWYRGSGDLSPIAGFVFSNIRVLFNYDINMSKLKSASNGRGGPEVSIVYIVRPGSGNRPSDFGDYKKGKFKCPSFG